MYEDVNGTMIPGSVFRQIMHADFHHRVREAQSVPALFEDQPPYDANVTCDEVIDGDTSIVDMLEEFGC